MPKPTRKTSAKCYKTIAIRTPYWRPSTDYHQQIIRALRGRIQNGDIVTISEKAISTATGNIMDENPIQPGRLAKFLAQTWMPTIWGQILGTFCHLRKSTIKRFKNYPSAEGSKHKQLALWQGGFLQALMHGSEGAIDGSNLPYSLVSLPLRNAVQIATELRNLVKTELERTTLVMIVDTDKTYTFRNFHFTPRPKPLNGIQSHGGILAYVLGRFLKLKQRSTPIAVSGIRISVEQALQMAETANRARGYGAGRNVWDMAETFAVPLTEVTWEMLDKVEHKPLVILRRKSENR